ncbi:hypothetical protein LINPERPRIM_LOCUS38360 [Linum perenne]
MTCVASSTSYVTINLFLREVTKLFYHIKKMKRDEEKSYQQWQGQWRRKLRSIGLRTLLTSKLTDSSTSELYSIHERRWKSFHILSS